MAELTLDGFGPLPLVGPSSVQEVATLVQQANGAGNALYPVGGRTKLHLGCPPTRKGLVVDLLGLNQVIDFPARDMTITVQAGITMARLQEMLAPENLRLPIDVPQSNQATLGGILATNTSGSRRLGYGTLRDYLLGFSAVNDQGQEIKAGGRVVKNVAGYDLCKLFVGSLGTLGIITQATLKLRPLPEEQALVTLTGTNEQRETLLNQLLLSRTRPVCLDLLNHGAAKVLFSRAGLSPPNASWILLTGFEGNSEAVHWQVQQLVRELGTGAALQARIGCTAKALCLNLVEFPALDPAPFSLQANLLPSGVGPFFQTVDAGEPSPLLQAHAGNGIVLGHYPDDLTLDQATAILNLWRSSAKLFQGRVVVTRCPSSWKTPQFVWGPPGEDAWLMREVKARFDPQRLFNPGRFIDGL
jgi:glycolate oxidase FAD binding subunit